MEEMETKRSGIVDDAVFVLSAVGGGGEKVCFVCRELEPTVIAKVTLENDYDYTAELCHICAVPLAGVSIEILYHIPEYVLCAN